MEFITSHLTLREFRQSDFISFRALESHPETYRYESASPDEAATRAYLERAIADAGQSPRTRYRFAITIRPEERVVGRVTLAMMNDSIQEWEIGWAMHPSEWGKGLATEAARRVVEFAFAGLQAHRVVAFSHAGNSASIRIMEKLGMQQDGLLRETRHWRGGWADEVVFSILEREWMAAAASSPGHMLSNRLPT